MIWDTGVADAIAAMPDGQAPADPRAIHWRRPKTLATQLGELGVKPAEVKYIAVSHTHPDHIGNVELFPQAMLLVQAAEYDWPCDTLSYDRELLVVPDHGLTSTIPRTVPSRLVCQVSRSSRISPSSSTPARIQNTLAPKGASASAWEKSVRDSLEACSSLKSASMISTTSTSRGAAALIAYSFPPTRRPNSPMQRIKRTACNSAVNAGIG